MIKKSLLLIVFALVLLPGSTSANGLDLKGLGTRAQAMGGAFVSIADDFSAVFWNPAGAAGFRKELFGFAAMDAMPRATYSQVGRSAGYPDIEATTEASHLLGFLASYYKPIGSRIVLGLGIGTPVVLGTRWNGSDLKALSGGTAYDWSSKTDVFSLSPLIAVRLSEAVSLGAAINIDYGTMYLKKWAGTTSYPFSPPISPPPDLGQYEETMNGWGVGAVVGVLIKPVKKLDFGLTVRTPTTLSFDGTASMSNMTLYGMPESSDLKCKITWPLGIAAGVSFWPTSRLLLSADVSWTQWSRLAQIQTTFLDGTWHALAAVDGRDLWLLEWNDTTQIRFGVEYRLNATTALRAGYHHDPSPSPAVRLDFLCPSHTFDAFAVGIGRTFGRARIDLGLEWLAGDERSYDWGFKTATYGMRMIVPTASMSYEF